MTFARFVSTLRNSSTSISQNTNKNMLNLYYNHVMNSCDHVKKRVNTLESHQDITAYMYQVYDTIQKDDEYFVSKSNEFAYKN